MKGNVVVIALLTLVGLAAVDWVAGGAGEPGDPPRPVSTAPAEEGRVLCQVGVDCRTTGGHAWCLTPEANDAFQEAATTGHVEGIQRLLDSRRCAVAPDGMRARLADLSWDGTARARIFASSGESVLAWGPMEGLERAGG